MHRDEIELHLLQATTRHSEEWSLRIYQSHSIPPTLWIHIALRAFASVALSATWSRTLENKCKGSPRLGFAS
jgi:hypothetical protein